MSKPHSVTQDQVISCSQESSSMLPKGWLDQSLDSLASIAPVQWLPWPALNQKGIEVGVKREDLLCARLGGNKFYKLYHHLKYAKDKKIKQIISFGGAFSNHIYALSQACMEQGFKSIGIIRGERPRDLSATLRDAESSGMHLHFVSRAAYKNKSTADFIANLKRQFGEFYLVPEGGSDLLGAKGCMSLARGIEVLVPQKSVDSICVATASGGTIAGLVAGSAMPVVEGISVLKGSEQEFLSYAAQINEWAAQLSKQDKNVLTGKWQLHTQFHCGGYAKVSGPLKSFMLDFERQQNIRLDPVYTAKLFYAVEQLAKADYWPVGSRIVLVHSGGLQGRRGYSF